MMMIKCVIGTLDHTDSFVKMFNSSMMSLVTTKIHFSFGDVMSFSDKICTVIFLHDLGTLQDVFERFPMIRSPLTESLSDSLVFSS